MNIIILFIMLALILGVIGILVRDTFYFIKMGSLLFLLIFLLYVSAG